MSRPELAAEARLREAARSYRTLAAQLRRANPGRRAASQHAEVDVAPNGRVLTLRVVAPHQAGPHLARHFMALHDAAQRDATIDDIVVTPLHVTPASTAGLGTRRFQLPAGLSAQDDPALTMQRLQHHLRTRMTHVQQISQQLAGLTGDGSADHVTLSINSARQLTSLTISTWAAGVPVAELNSALAEALAQADTDLDHQVDALRGGH